MNDKKIEVLELKFDETFKNSSLSERTSMDRKFYNKKYFVTDFPHSEFFDRAFINTLIAKYKIPGGAKILDLGCGTGWYSHFMIDAGMNVTGLDFSPVGISKAKKLYGENANWIVGDVFNMPFKRGQEFDVIFCCDFSPFTLVDDFSQVNMLVQKIFEHLKKNGLFIFVWSSKLTGKREDDSVIIEFTTQQIKKMFSAYGEIVGDVFTTHKQLFPILGIYALSKFVTILTSAAVKIHHRNVRLICSILKK